MKTKYFSIEEAKRNWPSLKTTFNLAKTTGCVIVLHGADYNKRGNIAAHWFKVKYENGDTEWVRNQRLISRMRIYSDAKKRQLMQKLQKIQQLINSRQWKVKGLLAEKTAGNWDPRSEFILLKLFISINCLQRMQLREILKTHKR